MYSSPNKKVESTPTLAPTEVDPTKTQIIKANYGKPLGFSPNELIVKAGIPVRLEVIATMDGRGCMGTITIPGLDNRVQSLVKGQTNILEFTPQAQGEYPITCAMGMSHGAAIIVQ